MTDESTMRMRLQHVAAYRELRRTVQRSGRENVVFAFIMGGLAYFFHEQGGLRAQQIVLLYGLLALGELLIGLFKWAAPSAEGLLLDGLVLLAFAGINFWLQYERFQQGGRIDPVLMFLGLFMLFGAINRFKFYIQLRRLFADRPSREHIAWFDDLVNEIQFADPLSDELVLDLPTRPHWKAKLLGSTAFFTDKNGSSIWVVGADQFSLKREKSDRGTGHRKALLNIQGEIYPEFDLEDVSWMNYQKWLADQLTHEPVS